MPRFRPTRSELCSRPPMTSGRRSASGSGSAPEPLPTPCGTFSPAPSSASSITSNLSPLVYSLSSSSSMRLLARSFFIPPRPAYGFIGEPSSSSTTGRSVGSSVSALPSPVRNECSRSCCHLPVFPFLGGDCCDCGLEPCKRVGRRGVLNASKERRAFSAVLTR